MGQALSVFKCLLGNKLTNFCACITVVGAEVAHQLDHQANIVIVILDRLTQIDSRYTPKVKCCLGRLAGRLNLI